MSQDWSWIFDGRANVKVFRLRVVGRDEEKAAVIFIVNSGGIHEPSGTGWFERIRKLPNIKRSDMRGHSYQPVVLEETDHFSLTTFISLQESILIRGNVFAT